MSFEKTAAEAYSAISQQATHDDQKAFWQDISLDEERHLSYWERLLALEARRTLENPFDRSTKTIAELQAMKLNINNLLVEKCTFSDISTAVLFAFRLECFMLHPAFFILFRALRREVGDASPEDDYTKHIEKFSQFVRTVLKDKPEMEVMGDVLSRMLGHAADIADLFGEIKILRGLIPICASCKKVRDDKGYWRGIEMYLEERSEMTFTHGICPQCAEKLYPTLLGKGK
jgi:hypothetical protein